MKKEHKKLFEKYCKHQESYDVCPMIGEWRWQDCNDCELRRETFMVEHSLGLIARDICFAIWHGREGALKQNKPKQMEIGA